MITKQAFLSIIFIINGIIIGLLFDFFRISRRVFKTNDFLTFIEDIFFWLISGGIVLYSSFTFNSGELRLFMFIAILFGIVIYMLFFSSFIIKVSVIILNIVKSFFLNILKVLVIPIKNIYRFIRKIFIRPITFIILNLRKINTKSPIKTMFSRKSNKKTNSNLKS